MSTFFMFGKYHPESIKSISSASTTKVKGIISALGGKVKSILASGRIQSLADSGTPRRAESDAGVTCDKQGFRNRVYHFTGDTG